MVHATIGHPLVLLPTAWQVVSLLPVMRRMAVREAVQADKVRQHTLTLRDEVRVHVHVHAHVHEHAYVHSLTRPRRTHRPLPYPTVPLTTSLVPPMSRPHSLRQSTTIPDRATRLLVSSCLRSGQTPTDASSL